MNHHDPTITLHGFWTPWQLLDSIEAADWLADIWAIFWPGELVV